MAVETKVNNSNAVIYARYSSDKQNEQSIEGQVRVIKEYANRNNIPIITSYIDRAISGRSDDRPEFQQMIEDSKNKKFGYVLVYKYDRFSRDRLNSLLYKRELKKNGVKVISVTEYISDDPQGILFESIIDGYSEYYSAELAQKVKRGNRESRLKGQFTGGPVIYGYDIVNKKYVINKEEAEIVKKMFIDVSNGKTYKSIITELNDKGFTRKGKRFNDAFIKRAIYNEKYIGKLIVNGEEFNNVVPPIIDLELFNRAHEAIKKNTHMGNHTRPKNEYLLSSKLFCGCCGNPYNGEAGTSRHKIVYHYYKCSSRKKKLADCNNKTYKQDELENYIVEKIKYAVLHSNYLDDIANAMCEAYNSTILEDAELKIVEKELSRNKKETDNIINVLASGIVVSAVKEKLEQLEQEKIKLEKEYLKIKLKSKNKIDSCDALLFLTKLLAMDEKSVEYKRKMIDLFVRKVILYEDRIDILLYPLENHLGMFNDDNHNDSNGNISNNGGEDFTLNLPISSGSSLGSPFEINRFYNL